MTSPSNPFTIAVNASMSVMTGTRTGAPQESKETATEAAVVPYASENDEETANPLYSGDLIFHDDVYKNADDASPLPVDGLNLGIAEIGDEKENKEPYIPKDDIVG